LHHILKCFLENGSRKQGGYCRKNRKETKPGKGWSVKMRQTSIKSRFFHWQLEKNKKAPIGIERETHITWNKRTAKRNGKFHQELSSLKVKFPILLNASWKLYITRCCDLFQNLSYLKTLTKCNINELNYIWFRWSTREIQTYVLISGRCFHSTTLRT